MLATGFGSKMDAAGLLHMVDVHEDRIQRIEHFTAEIGSLVAEQNATMHAIKEQLQGLNEFVRENKDQSIRIQRLESAEKAVAIKVATKKDFWQKVSVNAISVILGAVVTLAVTWLRQK